MVLIFVSVCFICAFVIVLMDYFISIAFFVAGYGCNKRVKRKQHPKEGGFVILSADSLKLIFERKDSNLPIRACIYSADHKYLALGSEDNKIFIYHVDDGYALKHVVQTHTAAITALDVSLNGHFLQSFDAAFACHHTHLQSGQVVNPEDGELPPTSVFSCMI